MMRTSATPIEAEASDGRFPAALEMTWSDGHCPFRYVIPSSGNIQITCNPSFNPSNHFPPPSRSEARRGAKRTQGDARRGLSGS